MVKAYVPRKGDFIIANFDPQTGHEQKGRRPGLVVSNDLFNERTGLVIVCPVTTTDRGYPFHVAVSGDPRIKGFVMVEQVKSVDYRARNATFAGKASNVVLDSTLSILDSFIF